MIPQKLTIFAEGGPPARAPFVDIEEAAFVSNVRNSESVLVPTRTHSSDENPLVVSTHHPVGIAVFGELTGSIVTIGTRKPGY